MATYIFNGECQQSIKQAFIDTYLPKLELLVETTADYKKSGIYSAARDDASKPIVIDWGDGTIEQINGDVSQKVHEYTTVGTFNVIVKNIKSYAASINIVTWSKTTSQNAYTLKEVVTIPDSVINIEYGAFFGCSSLVSVTIPNSVMNIEHGAFNGCGGLMNILVRAGNANYTSVNSLLLSKDCKTLIQGVNGDVTIPNSVTSIRNEAFRGLSGLTSVTIPDSVINIESYVFSGCYSLASIAIPSSVTSIGTHVFYGCSALTSVTIPDSVTNIGERVFWNCSSLASMTIPDSVMSIGYHAFSGCSALTSVVFEGKTLAEVQAMSSYPWGITDTSIITVI